MNKRLIEKLRNGELSVKNDGALEELNRVLSEAFPNDITSSGTKILYHRDRTDHESWYFDEEVTLPVKSIKEFLIEK